MFLKFSGISYGMPYLVLLPSLIVGLALSVHDMRSRVVSRSWVVSGYVIQLMTLMARACFDGSWGIVVQAVMISVICAAMQALMACIRPEALGFGDVTTTFLTGLAVGTRGLFATALWWLLMGALGCACLLVAHLRGHRSIAFAPVIFASGLTAVMCSA